MVKLEYKNQIAFHPGYYIKEILEYEGISQAELANCLQISEKSVNDLLRGKTNLSDDMAMKLSIVFGTSAFMWLNLNQKYLEKKLEIERQIKYIQINKQQGPTTPAVYTISPLSTSPATISPFSPAFVQEIP